MVQTITIRASPNVYLAPQLDWQADTRDAMVHGVVGTSRAPHQWTLDGTHISSDGLYWDCYYAPEPGNPVYLYAEKTRSSKQAFDVSALRLTLRQGGDVVQAGASGGWTWTVEYVAKRRRPSVTAHDGPLAGAMEVLSDGGDLVEFRANSDPGGVFRDTVYYNPSARITFDQRRAMPTLMMSRRDWQTALHLAHDGAFGSDYEQRSAAEMVGHWVGGDAPPWVIVWKFPWDLNDMKGYRTIHNTPLPVGTYPFHDDGWWDPPTPHLDPVMPINGINVEKMRYDPVGGGPAVHHLESDAGHQVAMISSTQFVSAFWGETHAERARVRRMLRDLYVETRLYAFVCYSQHHAIVFYMDLEAGCRVTPQHLVDILRKDDARAATMMHILERGAGGKSQRAWADNYVQTVGASDAVVDRRYRVQIQRDGSYLEGKVVARVHADGSVVRVDHARLEDELFALARHYVRSNHLSWNIARPSSWHTTSAHVTLDGEAYDDAVVGETFDVTLGRPYHFTSPREGGGTTRWVVLEVKDMHPWYRCSFECHMSIGQQRT